MNLYRLRYESDKRKSFGYELGRELRASTGDEQIKVLQELERISKSARDIVAPAKALTMTEDGAHLLIGYGKAGITLPPSTRYGLRPIAHEQLSERLKIPRPYYRRMFDGGTELLADNVNYWLGHADEGRNFTIRTLDGDVRAVLSDQFRALDNHDFMQHVATAVRDAGAVITRLQLTDERLYIRAVHRDFRARIGSPASNNWIVPGLTASNSEVGRGGLNIDGWAWREKCDTGLIIGQQLHRVHLGEKQPEGLLTKAMNEAAWAEVADLVRTMFSREPLEGMIARINDAAATQLESPVEAAAIVTQHYGFDDADRDSIVEYMASGGDNRATEAGSVWGLINAVTRRGRDLNADEGIVFERAGGELLDHAGELVKVKARV